MTKEEDIRQRIARLEELLANARIVGGEGLAVDGDFVSGVSIKCTRDDGQPESTGEGTT